MEQKAGQLFRFFNALFLLHFPLSLCQNLKGLHYTGAQRHTDRQAPGQ